MGNRCRDRAPENRVQLSLGKKRRDRSRVARELNRAKIGRPNHSPGLEIMGGDQYGRTVGRRAVDGPVASKCGQDEEGADQRKRLHETAPDRRPRHCCSLGTPKAKLRLALTGLYFDLGCSLEAHVRPGTPSCHGYVLTLRAN